MLGTHDLVLFVVSGLLLNVTPGADTAYIVARSTTQGWRAGAVAALGIGAGCCLHALAAALGLSAILAASANAFTALKLIGAAYLIYLGISLLRAPCAADAPSIPSTSLRKVFVQGALTNVLNPKVALFFLAFLPQFVDAGVRDKLLPLLLLGAIFNVNGTLWNLLVARMAATMGRRVRGRGAALLQRLAGAALVAVGARLALGARD